MKQNKVSVIVPCYNVERYIYDCVESLKQQTYKNFEAIFVNDGSTDNTLDALNKLCNGFSNFKVLSQENKGPSAARNLAIKCSTGEYFVFLDGDDMYAPNYIEVLLGEIEKYKADCVCCKYHKCNDSFKIDNVQLGKITHKNKEIFGRENLVCKILAKKDRQLNMVVWNKIFKRSILQKFENYPFVFDEKTLYSEDIEFIAKYMANAERTICIKNKLIYYRIHKHSLVRSNFSERKLTAFIGIKNVETFCTEKNFERALLETKALSCKTAMEMLYRMKVSKVKNKELRKKMLTILDENMKVFKKCKDEPFYMKLFASLIPGVFKLFF